MKKTRFEKMDFEVLTCAIRPYATILTFKSDIIRRNMTILIDIHFYYYITHIFPENSI